jgi:hypothetical protein
VGKGLFPKVGHSESIFAHSTSVDNVIVYSVRRTAVNGNFPETPLFNSKHRVEGYGPAPWRETTS